MPATVLVLVTIHIQLLLPGSKEKLVEYNAALLSICMGAMLGFIDDVIELRWRHKILITTVAVYPLLVAYSGLTSVLMPKFVRGLIGADTINLGFLYYVWMGMLAIFCSNSINIYAGINGIEVGQSFVIGVFILIHNIIVSGQSTVITSL